MFKLWTKIKELERSDIPTSLETAKAIAKKSYMLRRRLAKYRSMSKACCYDYALIVDVWGRKMLLTVARGKYRIEEIIHADQSIRVAGYEIIDLLEGEPR